MRKIATFIFKYRPFDILQYHSIVPNSVASSPSTIVPRLGDKRLASGDYSDTEAWHTEPDEDPSRDGDTFSPTFVFASSDSDSSQVGSILYSR